ncbi:MAG: hypothetical protein U0360_07560 [Dehalococcoidia bacterium]
MDSGLIGKVEKAHRYAAERDRFTFSALTVHVRGDNDAHDVTLQDGAWNCGCEFFSHHRVCAHSMAIERLLDGMVPIASPA